MTLERNYENEHGVASHMEELYTPSRMASIVVRSIALCSMLYSRYLAVVVNSRREHTQRGMTTIEYALGCVAAAALGAVLYTIVTGDTVTQAISDIFENALRQGQ